MPSSAPDKLREAATRMLQLAIDGKVDWQARRGQKKGPLKLGPQESMMTFETAKAFVAGQEQGLSGAGRVDQGHAEGRRQGSATMR